jgi:HSP20 family protein
MANIVRRNENQELEWDPFRLMRDMMRWDPFREMAPIWNRGTARDVFVPGFEVRENQTAILVRADLPGVKSEDLEVTLTGNRLQISGRREAEQGGESDTVYMLERSYGTFTRTFTLPESVDANQISTDLKDGVLTVVLPKKPEAQPKRIAIGSSTPKLKA